MSPTRLLLSDPADSQSPTSDRMSRRALRHVLFAIAYVIAVVTAVSTVYTDTLISIAWPSSGVAVWWAVTCRSRRAFGIVCALVFVVPVVHLVIISDLVAVTILLVGVSHVIAGPLIAPVLALFEWMNPTEVQPRRHRRLAPLARIVVARHVYRLLWAAFIAVPVAKGVSVLGISLGGGQVSVPLYLSLVLRDLAGVIALAGPGIAISSSWRNHLSAQAMREFAAALGVTAVLFALVFGPGQDLPIVYVMILPLYWSATRLPVSLASIHAVITGAAATVLAFWVGAGPFAVTDDVSVEKGAAIQLFIIVCVLLSLVVSTTVHQHAAAVAELSVVTATIPDALVLVNRFGQAMPLNSSAHKLLVPAPGGKFVTRTFYNVDGEIIPDEREPARKALQGEAVQGLRVKLADSGGRFPTGDRGIYTVRATPLYMGAETEPGHALLLFHDSTDEYKTMQQLQRALSEARHLFKHAPQGIAILDHDGVIKQANRALGDLVGVLAKQLRGRRFDELVCEGSLAGEVGDAVGRPGRLVQADRCLASESGHRRRVALSFRTMAYDDDSPAPLIVNAVDVSEREELLELVSHLADHDSLTGLVNRRRFESEFETVFGDATHSSRDGALLLIDLDNFKLVNDTYGHSAGDKLLVELARVLTDCVRSGDLVGRWGGDEFVIALPNTDRDAATAIGARIIDAVQERFTKQGDLMFHVTVSIGVAMFAEALERSVDPLMLADQLLYEAKNAGRNRFVTLNPATGEERTAAPLAEGGEVERILRTEALRLELQPIAEVASGRVVLAEGLVRVDSPDTRLDTCALIAEIESAGLGPKLDACVLRMGIKMIPELQRAQPGFRLSLNMSAQSLGSEELLQVIVSEIEEHGVAPGSLVLEVTESAPITDFDAARRFRNSLAKYGVSMAIDDFGAGIDPFRYIRRLDFDIVKIAGVFVEGMVDNDVDRSIVRSIVGLASERGMATVAEYVSDERVFSAAQQAGVTYVQGYHIGAPVPLPEFVATHLVAK